MLIEVEKYPHGFWERIPPLFDARVNDFQSHRIDRFVFSVFEVRDMAREALIMRTNSTSPFRCVAGSRVRVASLSFQEENIIGR